MEVVTSPIRFFDYPIDALSVRVAALLTKGLAENATVTSQNKTARALIEEIECYLNSATNSDRQVAVTEARKGIKLGYERALSQSTDPHDYFSLQPIHEAIIKISLMVEREIYSDKK